MTGPPPSPCQRSVGWLLPLLACLALALPGVVRAEEGGTPADVASYQLTVGLDPTTRQIHGFGRIRYRNPSPDTLQEIWLYLYLNAFRSADTPWMREAGASHRGVDFDPAHPGWIRLDEVAVAESGAPLALPEGEAAEATVARFALPAPLPPGGQLVLDVRWTAQLPRLFARTGFAGDFVMAGQWYPKLAVYDRGRWFNEPWHANAEFFADFGTYDLLLTVPADYVTGASGVRVGEWPNADGSKTVRYRAERVTDIAWTAWPAFSVVDRKVEAAGQRVEVELLLPPEERQATERHLAAVQAALDAYGRWYGPYPWPKLTVVVPPAGAEGAGGMEYPSLVTTARSTPLPFGLGAGVRDLEIVTAHEIAHQWFPMQVQSNEAAEPWLDEGFADYLTTRLLAHLYGAEEGVLALPGARLGYETLHRASFLLAAVDQPLAQPSWSLSEESYAATAYSKAALALLSLERTLGDERFTAALRAYVDRWRWRHPTTADLQAALEQATGEDLDWFFDAFVRGNATVEYRVAELEPTRAVVERRGTARFPVDVRLTFADGTTRSERWDGAGERLELVGDGRAITAVAVDPEGKIALQTNRLDDALSLDPDPGVALELAARWLALVQALLQLAGQIG